jgi:hypothetical protein
LIFILKKEINKMKKYILLIALYISGFHSFCQEALVPMDVNPVIKNYISKNGIACAYRTSAAAVPLPLPFADDFSSTEVYPSPLRWMDNKVFINSTFARVMPTVGVATFDGLDEFGNAYVPGATGAGSADVLTSQPLLLSTKPQGGTYTTADSIYISFYYEKQGYGDAPETSDSLILEFYRPSQSAWTRAWYSTGGVTSGQDTVFTKTDVLIDASYLEDGFQFRFRNYGNLSGSLDHWHIDYVRVLSTTGVSTALIDQSFTQDKISDLETFTAIPWKHYKNNSNQSALIKDNVNINYIIYQTAGVVNSGFRHDAYAPSTNLVGQFSGGIFPAPSNTRLPYSYALNYIYPVTEQLNDDSSYFDLVDYFDTPQGGDSIYSNDTVRYRQYFYNYYAYDDGTCENGYDLQNAPNGKIAMKFDMLQADTLRGVQIFFAQQNADVSNKLITLKVWSSLSPEVVLYQLPSQHPAYIDSINGFATYVFSTPVAASSFYIGFQQVSADLMHVGYDRNTNSYGKMFYNITGTWSFVNVFPGTLMIRPLVGGALPLTSVNENPEKESSVRCYPNPTSGNLYISAADNYIYDRIKVSDLSGRIVFEDIYKEGWCNLSSLKAGAYMVHLEGSEAYSAPVKLIISR